MEGFEKNGFLSDGAKEFLSNIKEQYGALYSEALAVNEYCQNLQYEMDIQREDLDQLVAAILYARTLSTYQAFILVSKRGMVQQAKMLLRCTLESLFPLVAVAENSGFSKELLAADEIERLKGLNKLIRYKERVGEDGDDLVSAKILATDIKKMIEDAGIRKIGVADAAQKAGLINWYDTVYALLSNTIHASMRSLEEHLHIGDDGNLEALKNEPELEGLNQLYITAIESMLYAAKAIGKIFGADVNSFVESTSANIRRYYGVAEVE